MPWEALIGAGVAIIIAMQGATWRELSSIRGEIDKKVDKEDHERQQEACRGDIFSTRSEYQKRVEMRLTKQEQNFCGHSHEGLDKSARLILGK